MFTFCNKDCLLLYEETDQFLLAFELQWPLVYIGYKIAILYTFFDHCHCPEAFRSKQFTNLKENPS